MAQRLEAGGSLCAGGGRGEHGPSISTSCYIGLLLCMVEAMAPTHDDVTRLLARVTGDEKHAPSAHSTLDVLSVLYGKVLRHDPRRPAWAERDRFLLSKGHGPAAFYAVLAAHGYVPEEELARFGAWDGILG